jgi:hypothetical protein
VFLWPQGQAHYIEKHSVRLPRPLIDHALARLAAVATAETNVGWWKRACGLHGTESELRSREGGGEFPHHALARQRARVVNAWGTLHGEMERVVQQADREPGHTTEQVVAKSLREVARAWSEIEKFVGSSKVKPDAASMVLIERDWRSGESDWRSGTQRYARSPESWQFEAATALLLGISKVPQPEEKVDDTQPMGGGAAGTP